MTSTEIELAHRGPLSQLAQARELLEASRDLSEVKSIRDVALAAQEYARAKKLGAEAERYAAEIATRAERRIGQLMPPPERGINQNIGPDAAPKITPRQQIGKKVSARSQKLAAIPDDEFERHIEQGQRISADRLARIQRDREAEQRRIAQARAEAAAQPAPTLVDLRLGDFRDVLADLRDVDAIITDPPYPHEYIPLLADLATWADKALKPDGVLAVLMGQFWLPEVYRLLDGGRPYRWTACYLTPGNGYAAMDRRVQTNWKPLLIYGRGPSIGDIIRSEGQDAAAKAGHKWGQDYGAFHTIVERLTARGQTVVDPFMGSGTTLLAAKALGRHVIGCDVDAAAVATARERVA